MVAPDFCGARSLVIRGIPMLFGEGLLLLWREGETSQGLCGAGFPRVIWERHFSSGYWERRSILVLRGRIFPGHLKGVSWTFGGFRISPGHWGRLLGSLSPQDIDVHDLPVYWEGSPWVFGWRGSPKPQVLLPGAGRCAAILSVEWLLGPSAGIWWGKSAHLTLLSKSLKMDQRAPSL